MARITTLFFLFNVFFMSTSTAQIYQQNQTFDTEIVYKHNFISDTTDARSQKTKMMSLCVNDSVSFFQLTSRFIRDSTTIANNNPTTAIAYQSIMNINPFNYHVFKENGNILVIENIKSFDTYMTNEFFVYKEREEMFNWQVQDDTTTISGLLCQKALLNWGGREWIAWFTPEIPIFDGPYKFKGLPGLIVNIRDSENYFSFELQHIAKRQKSYWEWGILRKNIKFVPGTKAEFLKQRQWFLDNMYEIAVSEGLKPTNEAKERARRFARVNNNTIEKIK